VFLRLEEFSELLRIKLGCDSGTLDHPDKVEGGAHLQKGCKRVFLLDWTVPPRVVLGLARLWLRVRIWGWRTRGRR